MIDDGIYISAEAAAERDAARHGVQIRRIVVYHKACPDGAMAAAVFYRYFKGACELIPAQYQRPLAEILPLDQARGAAVYVVDFSFSPEDTDALAAVAERVVVLDHHKSAIERYTVAWRRPSNVRLVLELEHSGALLAWGYCCGNRDPVPRLIQHVEDYDLWRHAFPESRAVHAYLRSLGMDVPKLAELLEISCDRGRHPVQRVPGMEGSWLDEGAAILRANEQQVKVLVDKPEAIAIGSSGYRAYAVNAPLHQDDVGAALAALSPDGVGVAWYWRGGKYKVSLRSRSVEGREPVDVSAICQERGGGGHRGAASFVCDELPWRSGGSR